MTGLRDCWIVCDSCQIASHNRGDAYETVKAARKAAHGDGWHTANGRDICRECWEFGDR